MPLHQFLTIFSETPFFLSLSSSFHPSLIIFLPHFVFDPHFWHSHPNASFIFCMLTFLITQTIYSLQLCSCLFFFIKSNIVLFLFFFVLFFMLINNNRRIYSLKAQKKKKNSIDKTKINWKFFIFGKYKIQNNQKSLD